MNNEQYERLTEKMEEIANTIKKFPEHLQEKVYDTSVNALRGGSDTSRDIQRILQDDIQTPEEASLFQAVTGGERNYVTDFKALVDEKDPSQKLNKMEFATLAAHYFTKRAPDDRRVEEFTPDLLIDACRIAKRPPPKDSKAAMQDLRNAEHGKGYVEKGKNRGCFVMTPMGDHFVENELPKS
jgi:hypothetical protein